MNLEYSFLFLVVGEKEKNSNTVNVRTRDNVVHGEVTVDGLIEKLRRFQEEHVKSENEF